MHRGTTSLRLSMSILFSILRRLVSRPLNMENLPPNVLLQIFSYLEVKDKCRVAGVCKSWRELVGEKKLWKNVDFFAARVDLPTHWRALRRYFTDSLHTLHLRGFVYTSKTSRCLNDAILKDIRRRCPNLVELHIDEADLSRVCSGHLPPTLEVLVLNRCITTPGWFQAGVSNSRLDRLRTLNFKNSIEIWNEDFKNIRSNRTQVERPNTSSCHDVSRRGFRCLVKLVNLTDLDVSGTNIKDEDIDFINSKLRKLQIVKIQEFDFLAPLANLQDQDAIGTSGGNPAIWIADFLFLAVVFLFVLFSVFQLK
ncbi:F-box/LRR-repeat protein 20-like [Patiria miniata]|uniref:F-box domain-containing protein n=1 Tax=Patiria miniata TaxID=46514 RepID=A0A914AUW1_PATMI|nr:F-box/LRR-repeat protein 20-like [Patiria miniata]